MNSLALTDHGNLHGALEFYRKANDAGVKPIIGYEAYIAPGSRFDKSAGRMKDSSYHLTLLCQNRAGFKNLVKMASAASLEGFYFKPRIDKDLLEAHSEGIICLSGCVSSELNQALLRGDSDSIEDHLAKAADVAQWFQGVFGDRYFLEVMTMPTSEKAHMPPKDQLKDSDIAKVREWISAGALLDAAPPPSALPARAAAPAMQAWTNAEGTTIQAALLRVEGENVIFKLQDGRELPYPITKLSAESQTKARETAGQ